MRRSPYVRFRSKALSLTDHLAIDRTVLASERTFLAYIRTSLALAVIGATFLHFLEELVFHIAGWGFLVLGMATFCVGAVQFLRVRRRLGDLGSAAHDEQDQTAGQTRQSGTEAPTSPPA